MKYTLNEYKKTYLKQIAPYMWFHHCNCEQKFATVKGEIINYDYFIISHIDGSNNCEILFVTDSTPKNLTEKRVHLKKGEIFTVCDEAIKITI